MCLPKPSGLQILITARPAARIKTTSKTSWPSSVSPDPTSFASSRARTLSLGANLWRPGALSSPATIRRKLAALSSLFDHLCEANAVPHNVVDGVKRPAAEANEGKTPAIGDGQARALLDAPATDTLKGKRDRAILATFLYHGLRCEELCKLKVKDLQLRGGVLHLRVHGKRGKMRFLPAHAAALDRINTYLEAAGHRQDSDGPLFRPVKNPISGNLEKPLSPGAVYTRIVK